MFKISTKHIIPLFISIFLHLALLSLIISINDNLEEVKNDMAITVSIISSLQEDVSDSKAAKKEHKFLSKKLEEGQKVKEITKKSDKIDKEQSEKEEEIINDLSYSRDSYKIGSEQNPPPPYPRIAKLRRYQGRVEISVTSDSQGNVISAEIYQSSGYPSLDQTALKTLRKWRFNINNLSTKSLDQDHYYRIIVPINFLLE